MSVTSPIFWLSGPTTSVPLNFDASHWSGFCELTKAALPLAAPLTWPVVAGIALSLLAAAGLPWSLLAAAGGLVGELGAFGACANAPDSSSADSAVPSINVFNIIASLELCGGGICPLWRKRWLRG